MASLTPQNALKLSAWLASQHPALFRQILTATQKLQRSPLGRLGMFGDAGLDLSDNMLSSATPSFSDPGGALSDLSLDSLGTSGGGSDYSLGGSFSSAFDSALNMPDFTSAPSDSFSSAFDSALNMPLSSSPSFSDSDSFFSGMAQPAASNAIADSSNSFWGAIGSSVSGIGSAVGKVAGALLAPQTLSAAANVASTYFKSQAQTAQTQAQAQVVQAQLARTAAGASPATIAYMTDPTTGRATPVYVTPSGMQPVTPSLLSQLTQPSTMGLSSLSPLVLIGGAALLLLALLAGRGSASTDST